MTALCFDVRRAITSIHQPPHRTVIHDGYRLPVEAFSRGRLRGRTGFWVGMVLTVILMRPVYLAAQEIGLKDLIIHQHVLPIPFRISGSFGLAYELHITNINRYQATLEEIEILAAPSLELLQRISDDSLGPDVIWNPGVTPDDEEHRVLNSGMSTVLLIYLVFDSQSVIPDSVVHRVRSSIVTASGSVTELVTETEPMGLLREEDPLIIGPPVAAGQWFVGNCVDAGRYGHRGSIQSANGKLVAPQRFAMDLLALNHDGTLTSVEGPKTNEDFFTHGAEVLAVLDGTVVRVLDHVPENAPFTREMPVTRTRENTPGNHVVLDLGSGRFAFYAHLKPSSIRVKVGDVVRKGEVIGLLGNSGRSDAPHLHFHIADSPSLYDGDGLPFAFAEFELIGARDLIDMVNNSASQWIPNPVEFTSRENEMPLSNTVIRFNQ